MNREDKIKELFAEKLGTHEVPVRPELWNAIASQIGTSAAVTSTGLSVLTKAIIGISAAGIIGVGTYFLNRNDGKPKSTEEVKHFQPATNNSGQDIAQEKTVDDDGFRARTAYTPPTVVPLSDNTQSITKGKNSSSVDNNLAELQKDSKKKDNKYSGLTEASISFTNEPNTNSAGEKPAPTPLITDHPKTNEKKEPKVVSNIPDNSDNALAKQEEGKISFELTNLPNIYVLNAKGYFSIGYSGEYIDFQFTIMDGHHAVIFRSDRPDFEWRGTDLYGNLIEPGKYVYIITAKDKNGKAVNKYSSLTVVNQ